MHMVVPVSLLKGPIDYYGKELQGSQTLSNFFFNCPGLLLVLSGLIYLFLILLLSLIEAEIIYV